MASPQLSMVPTRIAKTARNRMRAALHSRYVDKLVMNQDLTRALVSFQANKSTSFYKWLKYREAFSVQLVEYILQRFLPRNGSSYRVLDPFAGAGTTLTVATKLGYHATGIELLPVGTAAITARLNADELSTSSFEHRLSLFKAS